MNIRHLVNRFFSACFFFLFALYPIMPPALATPSPTSNIETITVFFPLQSGFAAIDNDGNYSGYTYEYLMRISQLTGWKYEFSPVELTDDNLMVGLDQVRTGELHLTGPMNHSVELAEQYVYSVPYGETSFVLVARQDNAALNTRTLADYPNLKVAMIQTAVNQNAEFDKFCKENNISYQPVYANNNTECRNLVLDGLADVSISKDTSQNYDMKIVAKFTSLPFYFTASKENAGLIQQLNSALRAIDTADPTFRRTMHKKYFPTNYGLNLPLTETETEYLKSSPVIRVAILGGRVPIQSYDPATGEFSGILIDLIRLISERSGLRFEFIHADDQHLLRQEIGDGAYDIIAGIPYFYGHNAASGTVSRFLLTPPVFSSPVVRISNLHGESKNSQVLVAESIRDLDIEQEMIYSNDVDKMFCLVNSGVYGEAYVNGYMAQYCDKIGNYPNVSLSFIPNGSYELCLGVSRTCDLRLVSILTQAIATISDSEVEDIVYQNTNQEVDNSIWSIIRRDPTQVVAPVLVVLMVVLGLLTLLFFKTKRLNKLIAQEKNVYKTIAQFDGLSRAYNNTEFKQQAIRFLAQADPSFSGALIVCDIDNFKNINDTFGHLKGDEVIQKLGHLMTSVFRSDDIVGRLGGDEFVVLLNGIVGPETVEDRCLELKAKSRDMISEHIITLSIGVAIFHGSVDFGVLFQQADTALYEIKSSGKDSYKITVLHTGPGAPSAEHLK